MSVLIIIILLAVIAYSLQSQRVRAIIGRLFIVFCVGPLLLLGFIVVLKMIGQISV